MTNNDSLQPYRISVPQPEIDDFATPLFGHIGENVPDLAIRVQSKLLTLPWLEP